MKINKFVICPFCNHKNTHVWKGEDSNSKNFFTICKKCKKQFELK